MSSSNPIYDPVDENVSKPEEHNRTAIRRALLAHLSAAVPEIANRIFIARRLPRQFSDFPGLFIYTESETSEPYNHQSDKRTLQTIISVVGTAGGKEEESVLQDQVDDFCKIIEQAISTNATLSGLVNEIRFSRNDIDYDDQGEASFFANKMEYEITYYHDTPIAKGLEEFTVLQGDFQQSENENVPTMGVEQELPGQDE